ncbi:unnamed protein product [Amoebophrya sp. A120]|nr:unnamed protein product [Amoebophrya sp. A120]|eukprot:GSA120T00000226001.1
MLSSLTGGSSSAAAAQRENAAQSKENENYGDTSTFSPESIQKSSEYRQAGDSVVLRYVQNLQEFYELFEEVMPSGTRGSHVKAVIYARRKSDHKKVIIKLRNKNSSFKDLNEMREWILSMKYLYLLSGGTKQEERETQYAKGQLQQIANMVDILEDANNYYACMEHVEGRDLFDFFLQEKIYARSYRLQFVQQLCKSLLIALDEFQQKGLVHKDLKLENIVFDETKQRQTGESLVCVPKFIDFDTIEIWVPGRKQFHVLGTDQYIAPETYAGYPCPASDMWAMGVICYTMLTGCFPFHQGLFNDRPGENFVDHVAMQQIRRRMRIARIDWSNRAWVLDSRARDFVRRCFICDATRRLSLEEAQNHPWIRDDPIPQIDNSS